MAQAALTGEIHHAVLIDGIRIGGSVCLIARTTDYVIAWHWVPYESNEYWTELLSLIPAPVYVVCDGQKGMLKALQTIWPDTIVQRCRFHAWLNVKTSHLLSPFPKEMIDTAFFDRFHCYLPGWEIPKMRPEFFTNDYGFISDYFAECLRELRKTNYSDAISKYYRLGKDLNQRDTIAVKRTVSGLVKLLFPDGKFEKEDIRQCLEYALVARKRVKEQLKKIGGMEFYDTHFSYIDLEDNEEYFVYLPESGERTVIPEGELSAGTLYCIATNTQSGQRGLLRMDMQKMPGNGKISDTGFGNGGAVRDELKEAINYVRPNLSRVTQADKFSDFEYHLEATNLNGVENIRGVELGVFLSFVSVITERPILPQTVVIGSMSIGGTVIGADNLAESLQIASDSGAKKVLIPTSDVSQIASVPPDLLSKFSIINYRDPIEAAFKSMGLE